MVEDEDGSIWLSTSSSGMYQIKSQKDDQGETILKDPVIEHFGQNNGLKKGLVQLLKINKVNYFIVDSIYKFNENTKFFYSDPSDKFISSVY